MLSIVYPLTLQDGRLVTTSDYAAIVAQSIRSALKTVVEERVMNPLYGLEPLAFNTEKVPEILASIRATLDLAMATDFPDVHYELYGQPDDTGVLAVLVNYHIAGEDFTILENLT